MTALSATCYFRLVTPLHFPVRGDAGQYLGVFPVPENLWVFDDSGRWVIRRGAFPEARLWTVLDALLAAGAIRYLDDDAPLRRPLPVAAVPSRPALRVIRAG